MKATGRKITSPRSVVVAVMLGAALTMADARACAAPADGHAISDIHRYCTACWRNARLHPDSWNDCTQEVLTRLLRRLPVSDWDRVMQAESEERREFVRAIDAVKKRTQRARKYQPLSDDLAERTTGAAHYADSRALVNRAADEVLSQRQKQILHMSFDGYSVQDMATRLAMTPERVSDEKYKAIRKLRSHLGVDA